MHYLSLFQNLILYILIQFSMIGTSFTMECCSNAFSKSSDKPLKVALCTIAKNENLYIREWVEYYKVIGLSKIIIYDNNDIDGEKFEDVIDDYIKYGFVEIVDRRGVVIKNYKSNDKISNQGRAYTDCYHKNYKEYDWISFFDVDEFLAIDYKYKDLSEFLNDFNDYDGIKIQWRVYGDNGYLHYEDKPVIERFLNETNMTHAPQIKSIVKCKDRDYEMIFNGHTPINSQSIMVNLNREKVKGNRDKIIDNYPVYLNHFYTKSTEEFVKRKYNKTDVYYGEGSYMSTLKTIKRIYYIYNDVTEEKEKIFNSLN